MQQSERRLQLRSVRLRRTARRRLTGALLCQPCRLRLGLRACACACALLVLSLRVSSCPSHPSYPSYPLPGPPPPPPPRAPPPSRAARPAAAVRAARQPRPTRRWPATKWVQGRVQGWRRGGEAAVPRRSGGGVGSVEAVQGVWGCWPAAAAVAPRRRVRPHPGAARRAPVEVRGAGCRVKLGAGCRVQGAGCRVTAASSERSVEISSSLRLRQG